MSNILSFEFDELPLVVVNDVEACLVNGMAEIEYNRSGDWLIYSISVEGYQHLTPEQRAAKKRPWVYVPATPEISDLIEKRLMEGKWRELIQTAVVEQFASAREDAAEMRAEMKRDARMGL